MAILRIDGFEHGGTTNAGTWFDSLGSTGGTPVLVNTGARTGTYALQVPKVATGNCYVRWNSITQDDLVGRVYIKFDSLPSTNNCIFLSEGVSPATAIRVMITSNNRIGVKIGTDAQVELNGQFLAGQYHCIDFKFNTNSTTWTVDLRFDLQPETQVTSGGRSVTDVSNFWLGSATSTEVYTAYYDDLVLCTAGHTFPFLSTHSQISKIVPSGDQGHNAGTNIIEDNAGNDINGTTVTAFDKMDSIPPDSTVYVQQRNTGVDNYAAVDLEDNPNSYPINAMQVFLVGQSNGTGVNDIECRISDDEWFSYDVVYDGDWSPGTGAFQWARFMLTLDPAEMINFAARWGFSSNAASIPRVSLLILQFLEELPGNKSFLPHNKQRYRQRIVIR